MEDRVLRGVWRLRSLLVGVGASLLLLLLVGVPAAHAQDNRPEFVVVSIGDSFSSGEGNPEVPGQHDNNGVVVEGGSAESWNAAGTDPDAQRCHRSPLAYSGRTVATLQQRFPDIRFSFIHVACSGADMLKGLLGPYKGVEEADPPLAAQLRQVRNALGNRAIDALVMSIGVNDLGFGDVVRECILHGPDEDCSAMEGLVEDVGNNLSSLSGRYNTLRQSIAGTGIEALTVPVGGVYMLEYPDPLRDENGALCDKSGPDQPYRNITGAESQWLYDDVLLPLNQAVRDAVDNGNATGGRYRYLGGAMEGFRTHGLCSNNRFLLSNTDALRSQGNDAFGLFGINYSNGMAHPNAAGHIDVAARATEQIAQQVQQEFQPGIPTLSIASAHAASGNSPASIGLAWSAPPTRAVSRFELRHRRTDQSLDQAQIATLPAESRSFTFSGSGGFLFALRSCSPTECSEFSNEVRASNAVPPSDLATPVRLEQAQGRTAPPPPGQQDLAAQNSIDVKWSTRNSNHSWFEVQHRKLRDTKLLPGKPLTTRARREVSRTRKQLGKGFSQFTDPLNAQLRLGDYQTRTVTGTEIRLGGLIDPLDTQGSYEVRVRACSHVDCTSFAGPVLMSVRPPSPSSVGEFDLDPTQQELRPDAPFLATARFTNPRRISLIRDVEIRLVDDRNEVGRIRYDRRDGEFGLVGRPKSQIARASSRADSSARRKSTRRKSTRRKAKRMTKKQLARRRKRTLRKNTGKPRSNEFLRSGALKLALKGSRTDAVSRKTLRLRMSLRVGKELRGKVLRVEIAGRDTRGRRLPFRPAGTLLVR